MKRLLLTLLLLAAVAGGVAGWLGWQFAQRPLSLPITPFEFTLEKGGNLKSLSRKLAERGLLPEPNGLWLLARLTSQATSIQAGTYRLDAPISPLQLLKKLNDGDVVTYAITFVEGITFRQMREQMQKQTMLKSVLSGLSDNDVLKKIGVNETHPEGLFFPDTYRFAAGVTDTDILKMSHQAMQKKLAEAWQQREEGLPYKNPYDMLIMASIIEKETGRVDERPLIASVFINRLRIPMRLQTDPTVIYGMGLQYDGNIRRRDLTTDTPYNTYTRDGLPPTPIAMPGWGALIAAARPDKSDKLYFVAMRDSLGSHYFSSSLAEHNRAVAKYQLGR
jgi:UPF0755 protein